MRHGICVDPAQPINWRSSLNRGLLSWWLNLPGGQWGRGTLFRDLARKSDGTLTNTPVWTGPLGRPGGFGSITFSGTNDYITAPNNSSTFSAAEFTVAMWIRPPSTVATEFFFAKGTGSGDGVAFFTRSSNNRPEMRIDGSALVGADNSLVGATWAHVLGTRVAGTAALFVNGISVATPTGIGDDGSNTTAVTIGSVTPAGTYFNGSIDDVRMYERGVSAEEALRLFKESCRGYPRSLNWVRWPQQSEAAAAGTTRRRFFLLLGAGQ